VSPLGVDVLRRQGNDTSGGAAAARHARLALALALLSLTACDIEDFAGSRYERDFHNTYPLNAGAKVTVETFNGSIEVSIWEENTVDISGTKYGATQQIADELAVNIDHSPAAVGIRVPRPSTHHGNLGARLVVKVPRGAVLDFVSTSNGAIRVTGGAGPARLRTSNGTIRVVGLSGSIEAETSNGGITAELDRVDGPVRLETSNGSIEVRLPARIRDAQLQKVPFMLVVGDREAEAKGVAVRRRDTRDIEFKPVQEFISLVRELIDTRATKW